MFTSLLRTPSIKDKDMEGSCWMLWGRWYVLFLIMVQGREALSSMRRATGVAPISTSGLSVTTPASTKTSAVTPNGNVLNSFRSSAGGLVTTY